ncbi:MAG: B12-binding domain-containing radical SAM protein [Promethearchaeota archaeon]
MKIALLFPNGFIGRNFRWDVPMHPPLSLAYLAAYLRAEGHQIKVIDAMAENLSVKKLEKRIRKFEPDVIGITTNVSISSKAVVTSRYLRKRFKDPVYVMGGPWATAEYKDVLKKGIVDCVVMGEGEYTFAELVMNIRKRDRWKDIKGISFLDGGKVILTEKRPFIDDLDALPFPAWDLIPPSRKYNFNNRGNPFYPMLTSRGCPYNCMHCTKIVHGYKFRARSVESVIAELEHLKREFKVKAVSFVDDTFSQDVVRAEKILDEMIRRKIGVHFMFSSGIRADTITTRMARKMKAAGCYYCGIGVESGNQEIVNKIGKKLDLKQARRAIKILRKEGIITGAFFILGHPHDSLKTMMQTISFAKQLNADYTQFFKAVPFPGTRMYDIVAKDGKFLHNKKEWEVDGYNIASASFEIWDLKAEDVEFAFKKSYRYFYITPMKILTLLSQIRAFAELKWFIKSIVQIFLKQLF